MEVPYYTTTIYPGARLVLDDEGLPVYQGMTSATFTVRSGDLSTYGIIIRGVVLLQVLIPHSVANGTFKPYPATVSNSPLTVQYGHGLFGSQVSIISSIYLLSLVPNHFSPRLWRDIYKSKLIAMVMSWLLVIGGECHLKTSQL